MGRWLKTPKARGVALVAAVVGCSVSWWRYDNHPPGAMIQVSSYTVKVPNSSSGIWILPDTRTAEEKADKSFHYDARIHTPGESWGRKCGRDGDEPWPEGAPEVIFHWGVLLCNNAGAPAEFVESLKPGMRQMAIREVQMYAGRVAMIPGAGILAAAFVVAAFMVLDRLLKWVRFGS